MMRLRTVVKQVEPAMGNEKDNRKESLSGTRGTYTRL